VKYRELKAEISAIAEIANGIPEAFRDRCFAVLLQHLLDSESKEAPPRKEKQGEVKEKVGELSIPTPSQVKVFMQKTGTTTADLARVTMYEEGEVHFVQEPKTGKIARGQIEWALLIALRNAITSNSFSVDPEDVRSICQEKGFYDAANFIKNFKTPKNAALFQGQLEAQGESQKLTTDGQKELGKLIKELASASA
jgi:uncharacterized protein with HEPN domain